MFKIIPVALSLILTVGAAVATNSSLNNAQTKSDSSVDTAFGSDFNAQLKSDINANTSASFDQEGFVMVVH